MGEKVYICIECGKKMPSLKDCWWRHYYQDIEIYCYRCAKSHIGGPGCDFRLMPADIIPPPGK